MDREILFRGKLLRTGKWIEGYYCKKSDTTYAFAEDYERHPVPTHHYIAVDEMTDWGLPNRLMLHEVDPDTLDQYTGLKDRNGNRIFEGDIVQFESEIFIVQYIDGFAAYALRHPTNMRAAPSITTITVAKMEVIGNIHDNPEMVREA